MWFTIALRDINDIPSGTLLKITEYSEHHITVQSIGLDSPQKVIMHLPPLWLKNIGFDPSMYWDQVTSQ